MTDDLSLPTLGVALLRAAAEGRLYRDGQVYRWYLRISLGRPLATPYIAEIGAQLRNLGLTDHREGDTAVILTARGRELLAAYHERVRYVR